MRPKKGDQMISIQNSAYALQPSEGEKIHLGSLSIRLLASAKQTRGEFSLFDVVLPADFETPLHIHYAEDVALFVLQGALTCFWGDEGKAATAGCYFFQPKGTLHGFRVEGGSQAHVLYYVMPSGLEEFLREQKATKAFDCIRAAARHQIEILGPIPQGA
jgi:quercetin dioxygenase-like cupin family protein